MSAESFPSASPLLARPRVVMLTVRDLVAQVRGGEIRLPSFQRPLRWKGPDVQKLFDSIWRGMPVGSLLFWEHPAPAGEAVIGGATVLVSSEPSARWVVDGQQRVTSLAAALLDLDHRGDHRWQLYFDPDEPAFVPWSWSVSEHALPVSVLGDLQRLLRWTHEHDLSTTQIARIEDARQQLLGYSIPTYVVAEGDVELLRTAFARLDGAGRPLAADEIIERVVMTPHLADGELDLDGLQLVCDRNDFGMPSRADVLEAALVMHGRLEPPDRARYHFGDQRAAADALARAVVFLQEGCGIPHVRLVPCREMLAILTRWFHLHERSEPATLGRLAQWVWRASMTTAHRDTDDARWSDRALAIQPGEEQSSLDRLMRLEGTRIASGWSLEGFDPRSPRSRIEMLALLAAEPRDRMGPLRWSALLSDDQIAREIVGPRVPGNLDPRLLRSIANRALLDTLPTELERELLTWDPEQDEPALRSQLIAPEALAALKAGDVDTFIRLRAAAIEDHLTRFLDARAQWNGPVVRPHRCYSDEAPESLPADEVAQ